MTSVDEQPDFSLIETMRYAPKSGIERLSLHLKRLETSARRLGFSGAEAAGKALHDFLKTTAVAEAGGIAENDATMRRIRLQLSRRGEIAITATPFTPQPPDTVWRVAIASTRTSSADPLVRHKTTRRAVYDAARAEFPVSEIDEVILLNESGELAEGTITNIFVDDGTGRLLTTPLSCGALPGILRTSLICGKKAVNQRLRPEDLAGRTIYVGNSLRGLIRAELVP